METKRCKACECDLELKEFQLIKGYYSRTCKSCAKQKAKLNPVLIAENRKRAKGTWDGHCKRDCQFCSSAKTRADGPGLICDRAGEACYGDCGECVTFHCKFKDRKRELISVGG